MNINKICCSFYTKFLSHNVVLRTPRHERGSNNDANVELTSLLPTVTVEDFDAPDGFPGNNRCGIV
jgi:hypothetical protein